MIAGPGRTAYLLYHAPLAAVHRSVREGGPWEQFIDARGAAAMRTAAWKLPPLFFDGPALEVHFLTGRAFAWQSIFCAWSLAHAAQRAVAPIFHDDGTLPPAAIVALRRIFPQARFILHTEMAGRLETHLPLRRFPFLRDRFIHYPHIRKLINVHLGSRGWKLVLDSDLLFFRRPDVVLRWLEQPRAPLHLRDAVESYGYPRSTLETLAGATVPERLNVGLCGWRSDAIDWEQLEAWCGELIRQHGTHYLLEQALVALIAAGQSCEVAPAHDYITLPDENEIRNPRAVMHHYVASSKRGYFREAWRNLMRFQPVGAGSRIDHDRHF